MSSYVIGGGLSGLVAGYYNPEYTVLTPEVGGFIDSKFGKAFVVLHGTPDMVELFDELGIPSFRKRIEIAYFDHDEGLRTELSGTEEPEFARRYIEEKLPPEYRPGKDLELSAPGHSWDALFVDSSVISALASNVEKLRFGFVETIDPGGIEFRPTSGRVEGLQWDEIVSTVPAPVFRRLISGDVDWSLESHPTTYAELPRDRVPDRYFNGPWNVLYAVDEAVEYHRVVRNMLSTKYYVECLGDLNVYGATDRFVNNIGVIQDEDLTPPYDDVTFLGRYAEWQHDVRIDGVIKQAKEGL